MKKLEQKNKLSNDVNAHKPSLGEVCFVFFYLGLTTFGGASSMLVFLSRELVEKRKWLTEDEFYKQISVSQCSPGIIMVNTATIFGMQTYGVLGGILATLSLLIAPFTFIAILTTILNKATIDFALLSSIYRGIRAGLCAISLKAVYMLCKKNIVDIATGIVSVLAFVALVVFNVPAILIIIIGLIFGIVFGYIKDKYLNKNKETSK